MLNNDHINFTVEDKDTLLLEWDENDFRKTFSIKGKTELRTNELQLQLSLYLEFWNPFMNLMNEFHEKGKELIDEKKFTLINDLYNRNVNAVFTYTGFISESLKNQATSIYFQYSNILYLERLLPHFKLKLTLDRLVPEWYSNVAGISADYTELNDPWFWNVPEYREFIYNYIRSYQPFKPYSNSKTIITKPFNPTLDYYYLAQANLAANSIKDWFITRSIMEGFRVHAFDRVEKVYKQFINTCTVPYLKDTLHKFYTAINRLKSGSPAPSFSLKNELGQTVSLSNFKGKVVYIDFWGVNCGPCLLDIKNYVPELHEHYKDKDVVFINICVDAKEAEWKKAIEKFELGGINLIAEGWASHPVCKAYNIGGIPHYVLIDKNGKIVDNNAPWASELSLANEKNPIDLLLK
ncbi:MAG TPA: TlpA disulfide reductase family protein [Chitinophagaceae bacterium]